MKASYMPPLIAPTRGFERIEFEQRTHCLQQQMGKLKIDSLFFTTEPEFRYFSGFKSQFWESPTRPWFLVVPSSGTPIAVVPEIGVAGFEHSWIEDVRSWPSPRPEDDGISLLTKTLKELSRSHHRIGGMMGPETHLRMPVADFKRLQTNLSQYSWVDVSVIMRQLRVIKSVAEIAKIRFACEVAAAAFDDLQHTLHIGISEREACRAMHVNMLQKGVDACPYLISASGQGGYDNIIMGPTDRCLYEGDVLIIDTGANFDGYFCDFDRNYAFGQVADATSQAYQVVYQATEAGLAAAEPDRTTGDVWHAMWSVLEAGGARGNNVGRMGHGLGMQLTEWPSNVPDGDVILKPGMILTLEPGMTFADNKMMVHEENILITNNGSEILHKRAWPVMPVIS